MRLDGIFLASDTKRFINIWFEFGEIGRILLASITWLSDTNSDIRFSHPTHQRFVSIIRLTGFQSYSSLNVSTFSWFFPMASAITCCIPSSTFFSESRPSTLGLMRDSREPCFFPSSIAIATDSNPNSLALAARVLFFVSLKGAYWNLKRFLNLDTLITQMPL